MRAVILNILTLQPTDSNPLYSVLAGILWVGLVGLSFCSLYSQPLRKSGKVFWGVMIVGVPLLGLLGYALYSIKFIDFRLLPIRVGANLEKQEKAFRQASLAKGSERVSSPDTLIP